MIKVLAEINPFIITHNCTYRYVDIELTHLLKLRNKNDKLKLDKKCPRDERQQGNREGRKGGERDRKNKRSKRHRRDRRSRHILLRY